MSYYDGSTSNTFDNIAEQLKEQAAAASKNVSDSIAALKKTPDSPELLADMQHYINKWTVIFNIVSTLIRAMKDCLQSILQKI